MRLLPVAATVAAALNQLSNQAVPSSKKDVEVPSPSNPKCPNLMSRNMGRSVFLSQMCAAPTISNVLDSRHLAAGHSNALLSSKPEQHLSISIAPPNTCPAENTNLGHVNKAVCKTEERLVKKANTPTNAASPSSTLARFRSMRMPSGEKRRPVLARVFGGQGDTHRIHQQEVAETFQRMYGDEFDIRSIDLKVTGIKRDAASQANYDATNNDPKLNEAKWQEQLKTPQMQAMIKEVDKFLADIDPDVIFSNYDTIARLTMDKIKEKYGEDRPPMVQHLSDLGVMHIRWILKEFTEKNSKDLVLTSGQAIKPGKSDQLQFVKDMGVPPERIIHTGAPIRSHFNEVRKMSKGECRNALREEFGIDIPDDKMSFLTMSGSGYWPEKFLVANEVLAKSGLSDKIHLVPIAGRLDSTKEALKEKIPSSVDILGYTSGRKLALLQRAVDVNIIKGGGGGIPEVTHLNRAFLINDALSGPEPKNVEHVQQQETGLVALITKNEDGSYNTDEFMNAVQNIIEHPEILEEIEEAQRAHIIEDSAERIARILHQTGLEHFEAKDQRMVEEYAKEEYQLSTLER